MARLKFAIIGCGRISYKHVEAMIDNEKEAELVAVCDIIKERAEEKKKQYEEKIKNYDVKVYTDYIKMLDELEIDVVTIATESGFHGEIALNCLNKGSHVIIEKPMAMTLEEIDKINETSEKTGLKVCVCHQNRFNPPIMKLRKAMDEGRFGQLVNGTARILWNRDQGYYNLASWRGTKKYDGGTLMNQCIHNIDLLLWMMGSEVESVKSQTATFFRNIEMENYGAIVVKFKNGTIGLIEGSAVVYPKNLEETLSIFGETGTVVIGGIAVNEVKTWEFADKRDYDEDCTCKNEVLNVYGNGHTPLFKDMIDAINNCREPLVTGYEARKPVELILKVYKENNQL